MTAIRILAAIILAAFIATPAAAQNTPEARNNIVDIAKRAGVFGTLLTAATAAGFASDLQEVDGLTVFAPTDAAFDELPPGTVDELLKPENKAKLRAIIAYHILPARVPAARVPLKPALAETLNGCERVRVVRRGRAVTVDGVRVARANVRASNGIIHIIDEVLLPARGCP